MYSSCVTNKLQDEERLVVADQKINKRDAFRRAIELIYDLIVDRKFSKDEIKIGIKYYL